MNNTISTDEIDDLNEITPLLANQQQQQHYLLSDVNSAENTAGVDKKAPNLFPLKSIIFISTCLSLLSVTMIGKHFSSYLIEFCVG